MTGSSAAVTMGIAVDVVVVLVGPGKEEDERHVEMQQCRFAAV